MEHIARQTRGRMKTKLEICIQHYHIFHATLKKNLLDQGLYDFLRNLLYVLIFFVLPLYLYLFFVFKREKEREHTDKRFQKQKINTNIQKELKKIKKDYQEICINILLINTHTHILPL